MDLMQNKYQSIWKFVWGRVQEIFMKGRQQKKKYKFLAPKFFRDRSKLKREKQADKEGIIQLKKEKQAD